MRIFLTLFFTFVTTSFWTTNNDENVQNFQGKAYYFSQSKMDLGNWGSRMSEAQKKQMKSRLKNRLEKTFVLSFTKEESFFKEEEKVDAYSGATDSWGSNFSRGPQYKNIKENRLVQEQEFYGKKFLVKDELQSIDWKMSAESKLIGQYMCFKATASVPSADLSWYNFSWGDLSNETAEDTVKMTQIEAWYTLQIPLRHGPAEFWGLPGLILEVSAGNTTMLCSQIVLNPKEKVSIKVPKKGKEINKKDYQETIKGKMNEMRNNRGRRRRNLSS
ncbi:MAG: GLPGLI family protein [Flavobacteriaceae bacterium]|jgi:GLPGLI family protein|nr:GLPGLI family protein [Flavobacteriaceae bacterium]